MKNLFALNQYIIRYKDKLILGIVFVFLSNLFRVFQPQAIRKALDQIVLYIKTPENQRNSEQLIDHLVKFGLIVLACALLMGLFMYFMRQTIIVMSRLVEYDMRKDIFDHYLKMDLQFFKKNKTGDLMSRISEDVNKVRMYLGPAFLYGFNLISLFIVVIFTMFKVNFMLSVYTLLPLPFLSLIIYKVSNLINKRSENIQIQLAKITTVSQEAYSGIRIIKSFNTTPYWEKYFDKETNKFKDYSLQLAQVDSMFFPAMFLLVGISTLITIYIGGLSVFEGSVTPGNIAEFVIYIGMLTWPVSAIGWCASIIQQAEASQKRINEFLQIKPEIQSTVKDAKKLKSFDIQFDNVSFDYPENQVKALEKISLQIPFGTKLAIVGKTASGKSSLAELLVRMYDPQEGKIRIGDTNIKEVNIQDLRKTIAYVPQDVFLFSDTIKNNILFGVDENESLISDQDIRSIAKSAVVDQEILEFSNTYETILGERGVTLSGGQKQRVGISRALIKNASVVVLDDSLSAVDAITEEKILKELEEITKDKTLILVTHRLAQTRMMDKIIVMSDHHIVEVGSFDELMNANGVFAKMYNREMSNLK